MNKSEIISFIITAILGTACLFQVIYNILFFVIARQRHSTRCQKNNLCDNSASSLTRNWLITIPVLNESHLLHRCLRRVINAASTNNTLAVALDGKDLQSVLACENEIRRIVTEWQSCLPNHLLTDISILVKKIQGIPDEDTHWQTTRGKKPITWDSVEDALIESLLRTKSEVEALEIEQYWRSIVPIQRIPTSIVRDEVSTARKAEALNLILSLCGQHIMWVSFEKIEMLVFGDTIHDFHGKYSAAVDRYGSPTRAYIFSAPLPDYFLCIDVDESIDLPALNHLQSIAETHSEYTLLQSVKCDLPISNSLFGRAFHANYSYWFHWESSWLNNIGSRKVAGCSYYGSLGAIQVDKDLIEHNVMKLHDGHELPLRQLFIEGYGIEDYPFYSRKLLRKATALLNFSIGTGEAPYDIGALFAIWARWTKDNVYVFIYYTFPQLLKISRKSLSQSIALLYHGMSWFAYVNIAFIAVLASLKTIIGENTGTSVFGGVLFLICLLEFLRRSLRVPNLKLSCNLLRLPVEFLLFPVAGYFAVSGLISPFTRLLSPPISTPRDRLRRRPMLWVLISYFVYGFFLLYGFYRSLIEMEQLANVWNVLMFLSLTFFGVIFVFGLAILHYDECSLNYVSPKQLRSIFVSNLSKSSVNIEK